MTATEDLPATDTGARNVRVVGPLFFGDSKRGRVIPKWYAELCGRCAEALVADGTLEWTTDPVALEDADKFQAPAPAGEDPPDAVVAMRDELGRLRRLTVEVKDANKILAGQADELKAANARHLKTLGEQTAEIARLKGIVAGLELRVKEQAAELGSRPPAEPGPGPAPQDAKPADPKRIARAKAEAPTK